MSGYEDTKVVTASSEHAFQSALKAKRHLVQQDQQATEAEAMVRTSIFSDRRCRRNSPLLHRSKKSVPTVATQRWRIIRCSCARQMKVKRSFTTVKSVATSTRSTTSTFFPLFNLHVCTSCYLSFPSHVSFFFFLPTLHPFLFYATYISSSFPTSLQSTTFIDLVSFYSYRGIRFI